MSEGKLAHGWLPVLRDTWPAVGSHLPWVLTSRTTVLDSPCVARREEALVECVGGAKHVGGVGRHDGGREGGGVAGQGILRRGVSGAVDGAVDGVSASPAATGRSRKGGRDLAQTRTLRDANHLASTHVYE